MSCDNTTTNTLESVAVRVAHQKILYDRRASREDAQVTIEPGWWRASTDSDTIYRCAYSGACVDSACTEGHTGTACRVCEKGWAYDAFENKCTECGKQFLYTALVVAGCVLGVAGLVYGLNKEQDEDEDGPKEEEEDERRWFRSAKSKGKIILGVCGAARNASAVGRVASARVEESS